MPPLFYCFGACLVLLLCGFIAKKACLVVWLGKLAFLSYHELTRVFVFLDFQSPSGIN